MLWRLGKSYAREETSSRRQDSSEKTSQGSSSPKARLLQNNPRASLPGFPKGSVSFRSSTEGLPSIFLAESSGIATVTDFKKENPVRRRLEIKAGGYTYILEHASHGAGQFLIQFQTKYSSKRNIRWARLNVQPLRRKSIPHLPWKINLTEPSLIKEKKLLFSYAIPCLGIG